MGKRIDSGQPAVSIMRHRFLVYLAGPITNLSWASSTSWRDYVCEQFPEEIGGLSPLRTKQYLQTSDAIKDSYEDGEWVLSTQRGLYARDRFDCTRADVVLVNLLGATTVSIGTTMEIAWAAGHNIPVVLIMEKRGNIHEHAMIREACPFRVDDLDDGIRVVKAILLS